MLLPVIMVGAIFSLLASLNIEVYQNFITSTGLKSIFAVPASFTTDMLAVYAVFLIGYAEAKLIDIDDAITSGAIALMVFLILTPLGVSGTDADSGVVVSSCCSRYRLLRVKRLIYCNDSWYCYS